MLVIGGEFSCIEPATFWVEIDYYLSVECANVRRDWSTNWPQLSEKQLRIFDLLSQETRHLIIQYILGHPEHLVSLDELDHMIPKSKAAIGDQLDNLIEAGILDLYRYEPSEDRRDLPSKFYGFTERGIEVLHEYNYLRGVPVARALYENTRKSEKIERHENAPRPELPDAVRAALSTADERK